MGNRTLQDPACVLTNFEFRPALYQPRSLEVCQNFALPHQRRQAPTGLLLLQSLLTSPTIRIGPTDPQAAEHRPNLQSNNYRAIQK